MPRPTKPFLALVFASLAAVAAHSQTGGNSLDASSERLRAELDAALGDYQSRISTIGSEKLELLKEVNELEKSIIERRSGLRRLRVEAESVKTREEQAAEQLQELDGQSSYIDGVLREFSGNFLRRIDISEQQRYLDAIRDTNEAARVAELPYDKRIALHLETLQASVDRLSQAIGGYQFSAAALDQSGSLQQGTVTLLGPTSYFAVDEANLSGVLVANPGTLEPRIVRIRGYENSPPVSAASDANLLPLDPTFNALSIEKERGSLVEHVQKGGWVGYVILSLGALSLAVGGVKLVQLRGERPVAPASVRQIALSARESQSTPTVEASSRSVARLIQVGVENARERVELLEECMLSSILEYKLRLERFIPILALTAATAPLLGLLGTVVGMIKTFTLITVFGTGDAKSLSSGISEALVTTELGLIIAVPALVLHAALQRMVRARASTMENIAFEFIKTVSSRQGANDPTA